MKYISIVGVLCITLLTITCKKRDFCPEPLKKDSTCDLVQSFLFVDVLPEDGGGLFSQYRKEYDQNGRITKVVAGLYTLGLYDSVAMLVHYEGTTVYFLSVTNPADSLVTAMFDNQNRLQKMEYGNSPRYEFITTDFFYDSGRLSRYLIGGTFEYHLSYDQNGNVTSIYRSANNGLFFTYDLTVKANHQFYSDHFDTNGVSDAVNLAQFMGWLPDLEPVNKRTSWKDVDDDDNDDTTPPIITERTLTGHVYDSNGNLVSYKANYTFTNSYRCSVQKNNTAN